MFLETRVGYIRRVRKRFVSEMPAETCVGVYRVRYSYYLGLVAGTKLPYC